MPTKYEIYLLYFDSQSPVEYNALFFNFPLIIYVIVEIRMHFSGFQMILKVLITHRCVNSKLFL